METVYRERSGSGGWRFWTYSDGLRVNITEFMASTMLRQGAKLVTA